MRALKEAWNGRRPLLFHNGKFDIDVATTHCGLPEPSWQRTHDTLYLLFLYNPNAETIALKPSAHLLLGLPPEEQDAVRAWLVAHHVVRDDNKDWGAYISRAPADLVGKYCIGDVERTEKLFEFTYPYVVKNDMLRAYDRERQLQPILLENERAGMRVDVDRLDRDIEVYQDAIKTCDNWLRQRLGRPKLNIDSNPQMVEALKSSGVVKEFPRTEKGGDSVSKKLLTPEMFGDPQVASTFGYRNRACTCLSVWMEKWLALASANGGYIFTDWSQVRNTKESGDRKGARTGRLACSPPFMNIPKKWEGKNDGYAHPEHLPIPHLPLVRRYVLPDKGDKICHRDYSQQELRVLAHFEDGPIAAMYHRDPKVDFHRVMQDIINEHTGLGITRDAAKIIDLALAYAMGLGKLAAPRYARHSYPRTWYQSAGRGRAACTYLGWAALLQGASPASEERRHEGPRLQTAQHPYSGFKC
jgi:DNA polymerase I-like protein with 3'-5' exonuclease and polymerase domains